MFGFPRDIPALTRRLVELERQIGDLRLQQAVVVNELERGQAHLTDASRTITEYVQARADVAPDTARSLVFASRTLGRHRPVNARAIHCALSFDRTTATLAYLEAGATPEDARESYELDLPEVRHRTALRKRMTRRTERSLHAGRYVTTQPTLDRSRYRLWGELPGYEGGIVEKALSERGDEFAGQCPDLRATGGQRRADALVAMAHDSLDRPDRSVDTPAATGGPSVTVFVDATSEEASSRAQVAYGARVGPDTLEAILCTGSVRVIGMDGARPVTSSRAARAIPPAIRAAVAHRDGGCTIDGCRSRYRLQPHHIRHWAEGGSHDPDNLATVCWYHHHVAIHRSGFRIDPESPPHRRRLVRPGAVGARSGADPP